MTLGHRTDRRHVCRGDRLVAGSDHRGYSGATFQGQWRDDDLDRRFGRQRGREHGVGRFECHPLDLTGGTVDLNAGTALTGAGACLIDGATANVNTPLATPAGLDLNSGTLAGAGPLTVGPTTTLTVSGGTTFNLVDLENQGTLAITAGSACSWPQTRSSTTRARSTSPAMATRRARHRPGRSTTPGLREVGGKRHLRHLGVV